MKKRHFHERIRYWFDCMMTKGPIAMTLLLFAITGSIVGCIGIIAYFAAEDGGLLYQIWSSLMYTLDAGTLASVPTDNILYLMLMFLATLCGLFLTSVLIGVVTTGVEDKLEDLKKGTSVVQEYNHTTIIGYNNHIYVLLKELIEANSNHKKCCIVILGEQSKADMEDDIAAHITDTKTTKIICRSGSLHEAYALERCAIESCKSVIVNVHEDIESIKVLLALSSYLKGKELLNPDLKYIVSLQDDQYMDAATIAGEGRAEIIYDKDAIARIIANTCRQHGLSQVLTELFDFGGDEMYFESVPQLEGMTFHKASLCFSNATLIGLYSQGQVKLNPPMDTVIGNGDQLILIEEDDGSFNTHLPKEVDPSLICIKEAVSAKTNSHLIVMGSNDKLPIILEEYDKYVESGTQVVIVDDDFDENRLGSYDNLNITVCKEFITRNLLCQLLTEDAKNILLLNDDSTEPEASDSQTLLRLILLRDIADKTGRHFSITTEMRSVDNQRLAAQARVDDFVIGSNFSSLLMAQVSENPHITPLINDLLDEDGSELYMKPASNYVVLGQPVDAYTLTESAAQKGEIYVGYRLNSKHSNEVIVNPPKDELVVFNETDQLVVVAED